MKRWFAELPLHRKLVAVAMGASATALAAMVVGLLVIEVARFRGGAVDDARALAQVLAENTAAAVAFGDREAAEQTLASVRVRPTISLVCVYTPGGDVLAGYDREQDSACPQHPADIRTWRFVAATAPIVRNDRIYGTVLVERDLSDLQARLIVTASVGAAMLLISGLLAYALAQRIQRLISRPIVELASAMQRVERDPGYELPAVEAAPDEVGALVGAFREMVDRTRAASNRLRESNAALQRENEERRRVEAEREALLVREREASRLKDEFLAAVSHELRTPLNAILGWAQILTVRPPSPDTMQKAIASLARNAEAQQRVIDDLIDVSRIVTGKMHLKREPIDLRPVVESAIDVVAPVAAAKGVQLDAALPEPGCLVNGDRERLRQVLWNLLSNAVKFTPADGLVRLHLKKQAHTCTIEVSDTGIGIAPTFLPHVFERFRQADGSTTREFGGLGLGLAIVKELVELHGGSVAARSDGQGLGATFLVTLPQVVAVPQTHAPVVAAPAPRLDRLRVLVVDDNRDALDIAAALLSVAGAEVALAESGSEAILQWQERRADVLVCDLAMPYVDGFDVLKRIRQIDAAAGLATPAVAVTAYASAEDRARCETAGFHAHLPKPFDGPDLIRAVAAVHAAHGAHM